MYTHLEFCVAPEGEEKSKENAVAYISPPGNEKNLWAWFSDVINFPLLFHRRVPSPQGYRKNLRYTREKPRYDAPSKGKRWRVNTTRCVRLTYPLNLPFPVLLIPLSREILLDEISFPAGFSLRYVYGKFRAELANLRLLPGFQVDWLLY